MGYFVDCYIMHIFFRKLITEQKLKLECESSLNGLKLKKNNNARKSRKKALNSCNKSTKQPGRHI